MIERVTSLFDERGLEPELLRLLDGDAGLFVALAALTTAFLVGVVHAIGPGHGKTLIGAYLASTRGRAVDAVALGVLIAVMHTVSVLALGLMLSLTGRLPGFDRLEPVLLLISSLAVTAVGIGLVVRASRHRARQRDVAVVTVERAAHAARTDRPDRRTPHDHHDHHDHHGPGSMAHRDDDHHHHALPDGVAPLSRSGLVALASAGGLLPSPAAFVVLASAMAVGRTGFGLALVAAFGAGIALTLTSLGLAILWGRTRLIAVGQGRAWVRRTVAAVPLVGGWIVLVGGLILAGSAALTLTA